MENLESVIGDGMALNLTFDSRYRALSAEDWTADLYRLHLDDNYEEYREEVVASARLVRVDLDDGGAYDSLDAETGDLEAVGAAFQDRNRIAELDEESLFASSLTVIDHVGVPLEHQGAQYSIALVRGVAHVLRGDIIALVPASMSTAQDGDLCFDRAKQAGLRRHWTRAGFVLIPGTDVMMLPSTARE